MWRGHSSLSNCGRTLLLRTLSHTWKGGCALSTENFFRNFVSTWWCGLVHSHALLSRFNTQHTNQRVSGASRLTGTVFFWKSLQICISLRNATGKNGVNMSTLVQPLATTITVSIIHDGPVNDTELQQRCSSVNTVCLKKPDRHN